MAKDLQDKVFLMTGATEGIGKAAALDFAKRGATLVLVGRNREKSERVIADLKRESDHERIELLLGDMSKMSDVRSVANAFIKSHDKLHVLVNNAGAIFMDYRLSDDNYEMTFALNHLGYFLFTKQLLDILHQTPGARIVSTSSGAHQRGRLDLDTVVRRDGKAGFSAYADSKLANILFTRELARRIQSTGTIANCFHPGFVRTGFGLNNSGAMAWFIKLGGMLLARTPEKGAETLIWLATSPEAGKFNGEYFFDKQIAKRTKLAEDDVLAKGLWELSEKLV